MMMGIGIRIFLILLGIFILCGTILSLAKRKMEEEFCLFWACMAILMVLAGIILRPSQVDKYISFSGLILIMIALLGVLWALWFVSTKVSILVRKNQELAMQVTLLNQDCEKLLKEMERIKEQQMDAGEDA